MSGSTAVLTGSVTNSTFSDCIYPSVFNLTTDTISNCSIDGKSSTSTLTMGVLQHSTVKINTIVNGSVNSLNPIASLVETDGYWTSAHAGAECNIIARNMLLSTLVTSDGYSVLGRSGASSGTAVSIDATTDGFPLLRRNGVLDFQQLQTTDISGLTESLASTKNISFN
jgi:hypothetical protein